MIRSYLIKRASRNSCESDYFNWPISNMKIWLEHYAEARKKRMTIPELVFEKMKKTPVKETREHAPSKREVTMIEVVSGEELKSIREMNVRLKSQDPLRQKE